MLQRIWKKARRHLKAVGFEPDKRAFEELSNDAGVTYINTGLWDSEGKQDFFLTRKHGCSAIFKPDSDLLKEFPEKQMTYRGLITKMLPLM